ncbi:MAG: hypothetical protein OYL41_04540 [Acidobacteriota bacterium]|nr:hypothetical protein [Acidobacteriota bacterium]
MIVHLQGREEVLRALGWKGRHAEWIALAGLTGGYFTRAQLSAYVGVGSVQARHIVNRMVREGIAVEQMLDGRKVCRIAGRPIYRVLGVPKLRTLSSASDELVVRRLLSLDYVLEHPALPWLPTPTQQVAAFEALGIARKHLPGRRVRGRTHPGRLHFQHRLPIALFPDRALFVYVDPGYAHARTMREWGTAHRRLWEALGKLRRTIEVVAVVRTVRELRRARAMLTRWSRPDPGPSSAEHRAVLAEIRRIERAIIEGDAAVFQAHGSLQSTLKQLTKLREFEREARPLPSIDAFDTWRSTRLRRGWS